MVGAVLMLLLIGWTVREIDWRPREASIPALPSDERNPGKGLPKIREFSFGSISTATQDRSPSVTSHGDASLISEATPDESAPVAGAAVDAHLPAPELKLAVADLSKIFDAYYKTKIARTELGDWKGSPDEREKKQKEIHQQLVAELEDVIMNYSQSHGIDGVFDSSASTPTANAPFIVFAHPGMDITDDVIELANAGHE